MDHFSLLALLKRILVIVDASPGEFIALAEVLCNRITYLWASTPIRSWNQQKEEQTVTAQMERMRFSKSWSFQHVPANTMSLFKAIHEEPELTAGLWKLVNELHH